jgi:hypothetical protein
MMLSQEFKEKTFSSFDLSPAFMLVSYCKAHFFFIKVELIHVILHLKGGGNFNLYEVR